MVNLRTFGTAKEPADFNGYERLQAIRPILTQALGVHMRLIQERPSEQRNQLVATEFESLYASAAEQAGVTSDVIQRWTESFMAFGKPGLSAPVRMDAVAVAQSMRGTWELTSRFHN